ncbi:MAG: MBL fold metallo-hydrolase, partial [Candidatus Rokuibacteriota bacterium]
MLDVGWPITAGEGEDVALPDVAGLADGHDPSLLGVVISHPHPDHYGLLPKVAASVPVYIGEAASRILREAAFFSPSGIRLQPSGYLRHRQGFDVGCFRLTPFLNDHSGFDAYSLLIEAEGRRLFYTGDIRAHGRKGGIFEELLREPPGNVDVLLMEGTHVREDSDGSERGPSERDVEDACVDTCKETGGMVLAMFSPQNIDRLVTIYRACLRSGRDLVIDLYTEAIAAATGRVTIPKADWDRVRVYLPRSQKAKVVRERAFDRTEAVKPHRIYPEELVARRGELVMLFRASMSRELEEIGCLEGACCIW